MYEAVGSLEHLVVVLAVLLANCRLGFVLRQARMRCRSKCVWVLLGSSQVAYGACEVPSLKVLNRGMMNEVAAAGDSR